MKTITIRIADGCPDPEGAEKFFIYGLELLMEDFEAAKPELLPFVTIDSGANEDGPRKLYGIVIHPDGAKGYAYEPLEGGRIRRVLGGNFELIANGHALSVFANEDGLRRNLPANRNASLLCERSLVGPVVVMGTPDSEGETLPLTDEQITLIESM